MNFTKINIIWNRIIDQEMLFAPELFVTVGKTILEDVMKRPMNCSDLADFRP